MKTEILADLQANNDANFQQLDARMAGLMADIRMRVILGVLGAIIVGQGIGVYLLMKSFRNNSYEAFLEKRLGFANAELGILKSEDAQKLQEHTQVYAQPQAIYQEQVDWNQPPPTSYGAEIGQTAVSQQSMTNQWQTEPARAGSWQSPVQTTQEYAQLDATLNQFVERHVPNEQPQQQPQQQQYQYTEQQPQYFPQPNEWQP
jgi:hypothetical protein